ncbi:glycosyltransferase family 4 protein [Clostridium sp.]|uniref:glycosyltransferase family 4 protein n=1 Tax=Clostridium sp. TaxID=1506 RepID=UPI00261482BD|nr:glycosyltransferase family 4 protein [Clostridium sp.]
MNILYLSLGREYGGTEKVVENLIDSFSDNYENNITIVALENTRFFEVLNLKYKENNNIVIKGLLYDSKQIFKNICLLRIILKNNDFDIVHLHSIFSNLIFQLANIGLKNKNIVTVHSRSDFDRKKGIKNILMNKIEIKLLKRNNKVIAVSESIREYLYNKISNVYVIHNGIKGIKYESNNIHINEFDRDKFLVIFIGRLTEVKGIYNLVKIIKKIKYINKKIEFLILGEGELREYLECEILKNKLDNVKLLGFKENVGEYLFSSDLLIMPSNMEGIPITILEAISCGIPCVASNVGGIPEIINDTNGVLYENYDIDDAVSKLDFLENNKGKMENLKRNCKIDFELKWNIDKFYIEYKKQYENIIKDRCD